MDSDRWLALFDSNASIRASSERMTRAIADAKEDRLDPAKEEFRTMIRHVFAFALAMGMDPMPTPEVPEIKGI